MPAEEARRIVALEADIKALSSRVADLEEMMLGGVEMGEARAELEAPIGVLMPSERNDVVRRRLGRPPKATAEPSEWARAGSMIVDPTKVTDAT